MANAHTHSTNFMRGFLLLLNIIFLFIGIGLIGIGTYVKVDNNFSAILNKLTTVSTFEGQTLGYFAFVLIGGGIFTLLISIIGSLGILWCNRRLLILYAIIFSILMLLELIGFSLAFAYKSKLESVYKDSLTTVFKRAQTDNNVKVMNAFHELERAMKCCAVNGFSDYTTQLAPPDCFQDNKKGCSVAIIESLNKYLPLIGGSLGAVLLLELLALIITIALTIVFRNPPEITPSSKATEVLGYVVPGRRRNYNRVS